MANDRTPRGTLRVACIQMMPATGEPEKNIERAERLIRQAVEKHDAQLLIVPECGLTGYTTPGKDGLTLQETRQMAETVPGPSVQHFAKLARELDRYIIWSLHEKRGDLYFNAAVPLAPDGKILGTYRKVHINKYEQAMGWTNGSRFEVWPCRIGDVNFNLGLMICFDREVPEAARCLTVLGADVIAVCQATGCTCDIPIHRDQLRVRAYENEVFIAMANWAGPEFKGHSMILHPNGSTMKIGSKDEEILVADLDLDELTRMRTHGIYGRHHRRPEAYRPLLME